MNIQWQNKQLSGIEKTQHTHTQIKEKANIDTGMNRDCWEIIL